MMTDPTQVLLIVVITTLTILLTAIGVQIFLVLTELRNVLKKTSSMLDDANKVTHAVVEPVEEATTFLSGLKNGLQVVRRIKKIFNADEE